MWMACVSEHAAELGRELSAPGDRVVVRAALLRGIDRRDDSAGRRGPDWMTCRTLAMPSPKRYWKIGMHARATSASPPR